MTFKGDIFVLRLELRSVSMFYCSYCTSLSVFIAQIKNPYTPLPPCNYIMTVYLIWQKWEGYSPILIVYSRKTHKNRLGDSFKQERKEVEFQRYLGSQSGTEKELFGLNGWKTYDLLQGQHMSSKYLLHFASQAVVLAL